MKAILFVIAYSTSVFANVSHIECSTMGSVFLFLDMDMTQDLWHNSSDNGYEMIMTTVPNGDHAKINFRLEAGSQVVYRTIFNVKYDSDPTELFNDPMDDFWVTCSTH